MSTCSLRPLTFPEVGAYIAERLYAAGLRGAVYPFPTQALENIFFQYSQGVPRLINLACDAALALGAKTQRSVIQPDIVEEVAAELGVKETAPVPVVQEKVAVPVNGVNRNEPANQAGVKSAVDVLIQAMKQRRASPLE